MAARTALPVAYTAGDSPNLPGGDALFLKSQLQQISASIQSLIRLTPQPATSVPKSPVDGMIRLSRDPWRPVGGVVDLWVYYDAPTTSWKVLHLN